MPGLGAVEQRREDTGRLSARRAWSSSAGSSSRCRGARSERSTSRAASSADRHAVRRVDSSATVAGRGRRARRRRLRCAAAPPRIRLSESDSSGELCSSSSKCSRSITSRSLARAARTDAERGESREQRQLAERVAAAELAHDDRPRFSSTTSRRPARTTYIASPGSPSRNSHSPAAEPHRPRALGQLLAQPGLEAGEQRRRGARKCAAARARGGPCGRHARPPDARRARGRGGAGERAGGLAQHQPRGVAERGRLGDAPGPPAGSRGRPRTGRPRRSARRRRTRSAPAAARACR